MSRGPGTVDADGWVAYDGPDNLCFGCGQGNPDGLRLRFRQTGERSAETEFTAPESMRGAPGVLHGGMQATLIDEVMGAATHLSGLRNGRRTVTADLRLRYRQPTPTGVVLTVRASIVRVDDPNLFLEAEILGPDGSLCTWAEGRWRCLDD